MALSMAIWGLPAQNSFDVIANMQTRKSEIGASGKTTHQAARQKFEEELAQRQMDHAAALAKEQLDTAQSAARAARMAAWAAAASAVGAIGQVIVAIFVK
jgi:hypothetical protein